MRISDWSSDVCSSDLLYFERHDGEAATCEDFVKAIEEGAGIDLAQFRLWYGQAGTPRITARIASDAATGDRTLHLAQSIPPTPGQPDKAPMETADRKSTRLNSSH